MVLHMYKICKKGISRSHAPRGRDAWEPSIDIKSYSSSMAILNLVDLLVDLINQL
jgi:hypothetical protein